MYGLRRFYGPMIVALVLVQIGCASIKPAVLPDGAEAVPTDEEHVVLKIGSNVRISLKDGGTIQGKIKNMSSTALLVGRDDDFRTGDTVIKVEDIETLESVGSPTLKSVLIGTVVFAASGFVLLAAFAYAFIDLGTT